MDEDKAEEQPDGQFAGGGIWKSGVGVYLRARSSGGVAARLSLDKIAVANAEQTKPSYVIAAAVSKRKKVLDRAGRNRACAVNGGCRALQWETGSCCSQPGEKCGAPQDLQIGHPC